MLDPNVIISALLSPGGSPARALAAWLRGEYELIVSPRLLAELERALAYPKLARRVTAEEVGELLDLLRAEGDLREDPVEPPPMHSSDPGGDYLIALAAGARALLVSGDRHLLDVAGVPVYSPAAFVDELERAGR